MQCSKQQSSILFNAYSFIFISSLRAFLYVNGILMQIEFTKKLISIKTVARNVYKLDVKW